MARPGALVLVVGPSGAGKDTLMAGARAALTGDPGFVFARRVITREAVAALEDHDSVSREDFARREAAGEFALVWDAHGLRYGIPASINTDIAEGRTVVMNGSRRMIADAQARYPRCLVTLVTADPAIRAKRLAGRGRETEAEIAERLAHEGAPVPEDVEVVRIDNSGDLQTAVASLVKCLRQA